MILTDLYQLLGQNPDIANLKTHNEQMIECSDNHSSRNIPDALIHIDTQEKALKIALELEISRKNPKLYPAIFDLYHSNKDIHIVLYLVPKENFQRELHNIDKTVFNLPSSKIFIGILSDFQNDPINCRFISTNGKKFSFRFLRSKLHNEVSDQFSYQTIT